MFALFRVTLLLACLASAGCATSVYLDGVLMFNSNEKEECLKAAKTDQPCTAWTAIQLERLHHSGYEEGKAFERGRQAGISEEQGESRGHWDEGPFDL